MHGGQRIPYYFFAPSSRTELSNRSRAEISSVADIPAETARHIASLQPRSSNVTVLIFIGLISVADACVPWPRDCTSSMRRARAEEVGRQSASEPPKRDQFDQSNREEKV